MKERKVKLKEMINTAGNTTEQNKANLLRQKWCGNERRQKNRREWIKHTRVGAPPTCT